MLVFERTYFAKRTNLHEKDDHPEEEIIQLVKSTLGSVHAPKSVDFVASLPRSPNGKVLKREIRDKFWEGVERRVG